MSRIRQYNKTTGKVLIYESYTEIDPVTNKKRTRRKYLGTEDPATGELIPSSGRRGRKPGQTNTTVPASPDMTEQMSEEELCAQLEILEKQKQQLSEQLEQMTKQSEAFTKALAEIAKLLSDAFTD